jgi:hypothetical protein
LAGLIEPTNTLVIRGSPIIVEYKDGSSGAIKPGDLVYLSGTNTISEGGAATGSVDVGVGWAAYEHANSSVRPATRTTAYTSGCPAVPVILRGSGAIIMANVTDVAESDALTGQASAGEMIRGTIGTDHIYAVALKTKTGTGLAPVLAL